MFSTLQKLILASSSPRRQKFLHDLGIDFTVSIADIEEIQLDDETPDMFAKRMAQKKAGAVASANPESWVIGADTVVALQNGTVLGKPVDSHEALDMLQRLNNSTHRVITGMCLCCLDRKVETTLSESTEVTFMDISEKVRRGYVQTGEPLDKAGAYGIQGIGSILVRSVNGSCTNVIGLPVSRMIPLLLMNEIIAITR